MKTLPPFAIAALALLFVPSLQSPLCAQRPGGFREASLTDENTVAAAKAAVEAQGGKLTLQRIESAERQVVAGVNYKLTLRVNDGGKSKLAAAVVWRKLDGMHEVTSWKWLGDAPSHGEVLKSEFIYDESSFPSCHATTLVEPAPGALVAAWFGGTAEGKPDVGIWVARNEGGKWTIPVEVATGIQPDGVRHPCWNPVLFQPKDGPLMLFYKVGPSPSRWWGMLRTSKDAGRTWSDGQRLPDGILGPIKNKPVQLANGDILCPTSTETDERPSKWRVHFERSSDLGKTWSKVAPPASDAAGEVDAIQPSLLFHGGQLQALGRTRAKRIFETWSADDGKTWSRLTLTALPNPNSGTDAVTLRDGRHLLIYNHTERGRSPLNLAITKDGRSWQAALVIDEEAGAEFSYPAIVQTADGLVHITYTWKRKKVRHVVIDPAKLEGREIVDGKWPL